MQCKRGSCTKYEWGEAEDWVTRADMGTFRDIKGFNDFAGHHK